MEILLDVTYNWNKSGQQPAEGDLALQPKVGLLQDYRLWLAIVVCVRTVFGI